MNKNKVNKIVLWFGYGLISIVFLVPIPFLWYDSFFVEHPNSPFTASDKILFNGFVTIICLFLFYGLKSTFKAYFIEQELLIYSESHPELMKEVLNEITEEKKDI